MNENKRQAPTLRRVFLFSCQPLWHFLGSWLVLAGVSAGRLSVWVPCCQPTMSHTDPNIHLAHECFSLFPSDWYFHFWKNPMTSDSLIIKSSLEIRKKKKDKRTMSGLVLPITLRHYREHAIWCQAKGANALGFMCPLKAPPDFSSALPFLPQTCSSPQAA